MCKLKLETTAKPKNTAIVGAKQSSFMFNTALIVLTRKPCCRKETTRCRSCSFRFKVQARGKHFSTGGQGQKSSFIM